MTPERVLRDLIVERRSIDRLIPYIRNARTHTEEQIAQVAASIVEFGWTNPILVGADGVIIAGHARLLAARKLGMTEVPVIVLDHLTETQRRALVLADNRLAMNAGWDEEMLRVELESLQEDGFNLDIVGFSDEEIEVLLQDPEEVAAGNTDEDAVPETPETAVTVPGDVWVLGEHRLLCGDSTQMEAVEKVLAGGLADMVFTDPPYNVNYGATMKDKLRGKKSQDRQRQSGRRLRTVPAGCLHQPARGHQGRDLHLHVLLGVAHAAPRLHGGGRPLVHVRHLGQEHFHDGPFRLPAAVRTDPVRLEGRHGSLLVRRAGPGRRLVHQEAGRERSPSDDEAG